MTTDVQVVAWAGDVAGVAGQSAHRLSGGSIGEAWRVFTKGEPVFAKTLADPLPGVLAVEAAGLAWLREPGVVPVPEVLGVDDRVLVLSWVDPGRPSAGAAERLGVGLARLHAVGAGAFGAVPPGGGTAGFLGRLGVDDRPCATWAEFVVTQRLEPLVAEADRRGALPAGTAARVGRIAERLLDPDDDLAGPAIAPARVHGDLWGGNTLWSAGGDAWLIDPAAHGGHPESDLAMMHLFGGFPTATFAAYDEVTPPAPGRDDRVELHQLVPLLVHACLFGGSYGADVDRVTRRYS